MPPPQQELRRGRELRPQGGRVRTGPLRRVGDARRDPDGRQRRPGRGRALREEGVRPFARQGRTRGRRAHARLARPRPARARRQGARQGDPPQGSEPRRGALGVRARRIRGAEEEC